MPGGRWRVRPLKRTPSMASLSSETPLGYKSHSESGCRDDPNGILHVRKQDAFMPNRVTLVADESMTARLKKRTPCPPGPVHEGSLVPVWKSSKTMAARATEACAWARSPVRSQHPRAHTQAPQQAQLQAKSNRANAATRIQISGRHHSRSRCSRATSRSPKVQSLCRVCDSQLNRAGNAPLQEPDKAVSTADPQPITAMSDQGVSPRPIHYTITPTIPGWKTVGKSTRRALA